MLISPWLTSIYLTVLSLEDTQSLPRTHTFQKPIILHGLLAGDLQETGDAERMEHQGVWSLEVADDVRLVSYME